MKNYLMALLLVLALGQSAGASAQKHRHHPAATAVAADTVPAEGSADELEAFSDTTSVVGLASVDDAVNNIQQELTRDDVSAIIGSLINGNDPSSVMEMLTVVIVVFLVCVLAPVIILALLFWLIRKNRQDKMRLAELAVKNGQPIPQEVLNAAPKLQADDNNDLWTTGLRQTFLGIGLMFLLGYTIGDLGVGIGALVTCLGVGKLVIVKTSGKKRYLDDRP